MPAVVILAVVGSVVLPGNSVCAVGIFVGSLLIPILVPLLGEIAPQIKSLTRPGARWVTPAVVLAVGSFAALYGRLESAFEWHFAIPGLVLTATAITVCTDAIWNTRAGGNA